MAQQKGLNREIAARSLVTLIRAETHEEQTFPKSEIASATQEPEPPSLFPQRPLPTDAQAPSPLSGTDRLSAASSQGRLVALPAGWGNSSDNIECREGLSDGRGLLSTQWARFWEPGTLVQVLQ